MPTPQQVSAQMRQALRLSIPDLDTTIGTPVRKILDVVGEAVAEASVDAYLLNYTYDIDTKVGADLDEFVRVFGFSRLPARRATGLVTFERQTPADQPYMVPIGTQLATESAPVVVVSTVTPAVLGIGDISTTVPVQAVVAGSGANLPSNSIKRPLVNIQGVGTITNPAPLTDGVDAETDEALRLRFKRTVFRALTGTESMYLGTSLEDPSVTQANVIGATRRHIEQIELVSGTATSTVAGAKYAYPLTSTFGPDIASGNIRAEGIHYTFDHEASPPEVTSLSATIVPDGVYDLEFDYVSIASRNDPENNITNRVDIWVKGTREVEAAETLIFDHARVFVDDDPESPWSNDRFERKDESNPEPGNFFIPYGFVPVLVPTTQSNEIEINGITYIEGIDFWLVQDVTAFGLSDRSHSGIEFRSTANGLVEAQPGNGQHFGVTYYFNSVPRDVANSLQRWRLVTQDTWVHQAKEIRLNFHLAVIFDPGYDSDSVKPEMETALRGFINTVGFNGVLQTSDLLAVAHSVVGVDAVRFVIEDENATHYAIQRVDQTGAVKETFAEGGRAIDVFATDDSVIAYNDVTMLPRAANTYGSV